MKKILLQLIFLISISVVLTGCSSLAQDSGKKYWIDNPLENEITVKIDDKEHKIPSKKAIKVYLDYGTHTLDYNGQQVKFIAKPSFNPVILNPTLSNYISYAEIFYYSDSKAAEDRGERLLHSFSKEYDFGDGDVENVPFRVFNSFIIEGYDAKWDYDLDTPFPAEITTNVAKNVNLSADMKVKIFREKEFIEYIGQDLLRKPEITSLNDLQPQVVIADQYLKFNCAEAQSVSDSLKAYIDKLYTTSGADFSEAYAVFTKQYEDRKDLKLHLFTPELRMKCDDSNYRTNEMAISEALGRFKDINAWIIK